MAQKSLKAQAARNTARLNQTHLISLGVNLFYVLLRLAFFRRRVGLYVLFALPAWVIEVWFERIGRPRYADGDGTELRRAGEDLEAPGLTEWMWDVVYWTWGCVVVVALAGDWAWWLYAVVPVYSVYLAFTAYAGVRKGLGGLTGAGDAASQPQGQSKRQTKLEKRGGQKVQYR